MDTFDELTDWNKAVVLWPAKADIWFAQKFASDWRFYQIGQYAERIGFVGTGEPAPDQPVVFSLCGIGVPDLAAGRWVHDRATRGGDSHPVGEFHQEVQQ
jgi:hypothetical protein